MSPANNKVSTIGMTKFTTYHGSESINCVVLSSTANEYPKLVATILNSSAITHAGSEATTNAKSKYFPYEIVGFSSSRIKL